MNTESKHISATVTSAMNPEPTLLKYAEVTIIKNVENSTMLNSFQWFFGRDSERIIDKEKDIVLMAFDNEPPFDTKDRYDDLKFNIHLDVDDVRIKYMIQTIDGKDDYYFSKDPRIGSEGKLCLNLDRIKKEHSSYKQIKLQVSYYNYIFFKYVSCKEKDVLFIARLNSSESKPRYVIAYDDNYITKLQVIYIVRTIFLELYRD